MAGNEQRIDGDGQEVNALRFLIAGGPAAAPAQPAIPPTPPPPAFPPNPSVAFPPNPTVAFPQNSTVPFPQNPSVPFPANPSTAFPPNPSAAFPPNPSSMPPMMMMYPMYNPYNMYHHPSTQQSQLLGVLNVLRVKDPKFYREWYKKYTAHKRHPDRIPFPEIPGFPYLMGASAATPSRQRKESSRSSINGDGGANYSMSSVYTRNIQPPRSGASSVNGDYRLPPEAAAGDDDDMSMMSMTSGAHYNDYTQHQPQSGAPPESLEYGFQPVTEVERQEEQQQPDRRTTPMKFSSMHCIAAISPLGHLIRIKSSGTVLEFINMKQFVGHLPEYKEMETFPGPLIQGSTHKNTVIQFCRRKIKEARLNSAQQDKDNYILLWEFLVLMLRQNGMVVGSDIAELLLTSAKQEEKKVEEVEDKRDDVEGSENGEEESTSSPPPVVTDPPVEPEPRDEEKVVQEFCEHLLYGHKKDALDFAMDNGLWGHALFFASKMDERSYGHVLARFANGIALNSPLQTLYHIMCGKQPASVTSCAEESFGDWKPHLAMLLSNSGYKPDVEQKAILTLGDTLASRNHVFAAQFCYLMGHEEFRTESRLGPLLGFCSTAENYLEATQMTEVYEFARKLADPAFTLGPSFLQSKLDYAKSLVSYGFVQEALSYCEEITKTLKLRKIDDAELKLCTNTLQIAERIAVADESGTANSTWIDDLRRIMYDPNAFSLAYPRKLSQECQSETSSYVSQNQQSFQQQQQPPLNQPNDIYDPYNTNNNNNQNIISSDANSPGASQFETAGSSNTATSNADPDNSYTGLPELPHENNATNYNQVNGGMHMPSQPQMYDVNNQQSSTQLSMNPPNTMNPGQYNTGGGMDTQNYPSMDGGYSSGGAYDKPSGGPPTANNNNYWYNPYDTQQQQQQQQQQQPPTAPGSNNYAPSLDREPYNATAPTATTTTKKKTVRFEDEHEQHADVENSLGNGVQSVLRCRGSNRLTDPLDLKSALKSERQDNVEKKQKLNGMNDDKRQLEHSTHNQVSSTENDIDVETCGSPSRRPLLEVEYKSTYPIDEPIEPRLASNSSSSSSASKMRSQMTAQHQQSPNSTTHEYHNHCNSKTFPVDKECCDVNEPCEEHDDYLGDDTDGILNGGQDMSSSSQYSGYSYENKTENASRNQGPSQPSGKEKKGNDKQKPGKENKSGEQGWFSGLFKTLSLKPKNQMILPDDKNPTIVWDDKQKRWVNTAADGEDDSAPAGPPPKDSELMGKSSHPGAPPVANGPMSLPPNMNNANMPPNMNAMPPNNMSYQAPPQPALNNSLPNNSLQPQPMGMMKQSQPTNTTTNEPMIPGMPPVSNNNVNKYKLQKGRSLKNSYVDVLSPNGSRAPNDPPSLPVNNMSSAPQVPNLFIPPPSNQGGDGPVSFLTAPTPSEEVPPGQEATAPAPPMFNPAQFQNVGYPQQGQ